MNKLGSSIKERREVLLKSIQKKKEDEAHNKLPTKDNTKEPDLKDQVHDSVHALVRLGYDFHTILKGSKVNKAFLEEMFGDLGYCKFKPDLDIITSDDENREASRTPEIDKSSIQLEIQLFMMRVQLGINKLSSALDNLDDETQLRDTSLKNSLQRKKESLFNSLDGLFDKLETKEKELDILQNERNVVNNQDEIIRPLNNNPSLEQGQNMPGILVDSGFVKIASVC